METPLGSFRTNPPVTEPQPPPLDEGGDVRRPSRQSVSDAIYEHLKGQILNGELRPGESLPGERKLSEMLSTNRGGVREAIKRLVQAGLVVTQHGGATRVLDYRRSGSLDLAQELLVQDDGQIDLRTGRSLMEFCKVIFAEVARLAALREPTTASRLRHQVEQARACIDDPSLFRGATWEFWQILADASDSVAFVLALNTLRGAYDQVGRGLRTLPVRERELEDLERIALAVERGDGDAAHDLTLDRFQRIGRRLRRSTQPEQTSAPES